jgi:UDP-N-acetylmuramoyl-L-alanyl-D-glutamate--2,6-diaminopimelate ligase
MEAIESTGTMDVNFTSLAYDSRVVEPGALFFALPGQVTDGHRFLSRAQADGAAAVVVERPDRSLECPQVVVKNSRRALALAAAEFYRSPSSELKLVGITGTNGKTTTSFLIENILKTAGHFSGMVGTVFYRIKDEQFPAARTTPESLDLQRLLRQMIDEGVSHAVIEVSSHGLVMDRVTGTSFDVAVYTNLSQDHLDFHHSLEEYFEAKLRLFTEVLPGGRDKKSVAVINVDDPWGRRICQSCKGGDMITYAADSPADVRPGKYELGVHGIKAEITGPWGSLEVSSGLWGRYNLYNIMAACAAAYALGIAPEAAARGIESLENVPGRLERVGAGLGGPAVLVDYAHSPAAVENLFSSVAAVAPKRIIGVLGAGGDRDKGKRPLMAAAAAADTRVLIITSDNPRSEDPLKIIADMEAGIKDKKRLDASEAASGAEGYLVEPDRRQAIELAVNIASKEEIIIIAGKGHETYQTVGSTNLPFDDRKEALRALKDRSGV